MTSKLAIFTTALLLSSAAARGDVVISSDPTQNMTCSGGVCSPTAPDAVLNVTDLANMLAARDTKVTTGSGAVNIDVVAALSWSSTNRLTLDANTNLNIQAPVTVAGIGALTLTYNNGGSNGDLIFSNGGNATFANLSSSMIINGKSYSLVADLSTLAALVKQNKAGFFALATDYNAASDGTYKRAPVHVLTGTFDGLGHLIANLKITDTRSKDRYVGLFGSLGAPKSRMYGSIRNVTIDQATVQANVQGAWAGVLIGLSYGNVSRCFATGAVTADSAGGLMGVADGGTVSNSGASVSVEGRYAAGGLAAASGSRIVNSFAHGTVSGNTSGGLIAQNYSRIESSYSTGLVSGNAFAAVGGVAGVDELGSSISNSYAVGTVTGGDKSVVGGLVGASYKWKGQQNATNVLTSYSIGAVGGGTNSRVGGFAGTIDGTTHNYWDVTTSGTSQGVGKGCSGGSCAANVTGLTDAQLKSGLPAGFDPNICGSNPNINNGYPYLLANPPPK